MKRIITKLLIFLAICIMFSIIYIFIPDGHFGGLNKIQSILEKEVLEKVVEKKIKENFKDKKSEINIKAITSEINDLDLDKEITGIPIKKKKLFDKVFDRVYFSIVTGSTLGYGDIYPNSRLTKLLVIIHLLILFLIIAF